MSDFDAWQGLSLHRASLGDDHIIAAANFGAEDNYNDNDHDDNR